MAFQQSDIDALMAAIAAGTRDVAYGNNRVSYRSLAEMREILDMMKSEVAKASGDTTKRVRMIRARVGTGL